MPRVLGVTDEVTQCECCGKSDLKRTVILDVDGEGVKHYGTTCAANSFYSGNVKVVTAQIDKATEENTRHALSALHQHPGWQAGQRFLNRSRSKMLAGVDFTNWKIDESTGKGKQQEAIAEVSAQYHVNLHRYVTIQPNRPVAL